MQTKALLLLAVLPLVACNGTVVDACGSFAWLWTKFGWDCDVYELFDVKTREADKSMRIATRANTPDAVPDSLLGLHYMDGNPLEDELVSFADSQWLEDEQAVLVKVYGDRVWSYTGNHAGQVSYQLARLVGLTYKFYFNADKTFAHVVPTANDKLSIPAGIADFDMYLEPSGTADGGLWIRNTSFAGFDASGYSLRRVVTPSGQRTANWNNHYINNIGKEGKTLTEAQMLAKVVDKQ